MEMPLSLPLPGVLFQINSFGSNLSTNTHSFACIVMFPYYYSVHCIQIQRDGSECVSLCVYVFILHVYLCLHN